MSESIIEKAIKQYGMKAVSDFLKHENNHILANHWEFIARPEQLPPGGNWQNWFFRAGRGSGKTRAACEWLKKNIIQGVLRQAAISPTAGDSRRVMVEGESGILNVCQDLNPIYESSNLTVRFPQFGNSKIFLYSAEEPDRLRGPQHEKAVCDELAAWKKLQQTWDMLQFGLRLGKNPQTMIPTTPRPLKPIKEILADPNTVETYGTTYDNKSNLASQFFSRIIKRYQGSRLGRQEIDAEILEDNPDALFNRENIDNNRQDKHPPLRRIVIALDPSGTNKETSDECGICAVGMAGNNQISKFYVLADRSCRKDPNSWAKVAVNLYRELKADYIVAETNFGGDMVKSVINNIDPHIKVKAVHASRGKAIRAEPVSVLYEQNRVHHIGFFPKLEDEMCQWDPLDSSYSPNRLDALVWGVTNLMRKRNTVELFAR